MTKTVMATRPGTYGHYREEGAVFQIDKEGDFSTNWMVAISSTDAKRLQRAAEDDPDASKHVVDTSVVDNAELEALRAQIAEVNAENERLRRKVTPAAGGRKAGDDDSPKTPEEVLAMANDSSVEFMTFKAAARKVLGDVTPSTKAEIIAALEDKATQP